MKILFFLLLPNPYPGAAWTRISFFAQYLKDNGHEVSIAGAFTPTSLRKAGFKEINGIKLLNITPLIISANFFSILFNLFSFVTTIPLILGKRPNIVVISTPPGQASLGIFTISKLFKRKIVFDYRDEWEDHLISIAKSSVDKFVFNLMKKTMNCCYRRSDKVTVTSEMHQQKIIERGIKDVDLLVNGADCNIFKRYDDEKSKIRRSLGFNDSDFILIFSGNIVEYYRVDLVIKALKLINSKHERFKLIIVGYALASEVEALDKLVHDLGLQNDVRYLGSKYDKIEIAKLISSCDAGVVPYDGNPLWRNSIPVKSFEYLACGLPIVATAYSDSVLAKLVKKNNIGIVSEPENVECLASSIEKIYSSDLETTGKRSISLIKSTYDRNIIAKKFLKIIEEMHNS